MKRTFFWIAIVGGLFVFLFLLSRLGTGSANTGPSGNLALVDEVTTEDHIKGNPNASITFVEYSDFQCPACASAYPVVDRLVKQYPNDVRVVYRHFPLTSIHRNAQLAAQASEAAANQQAFWEMHDALFNTQAQWQNQPDPTEFFAKLAESLGLNAEQFRSELDSSETRDKVKEDTQRANANRLNSTPSFFLNGELFQFRTYDEFTTAVEERLGQGSETSTL